MKRMHRREFAKLAGGAVLAGPLVSVLAPPAGAEAASVPQQRKEAAPASRESKLKLTPEQEERVKQAVERRERQLAAIRNHPLGYHAEPAFTFKARSAATEKKK